MIEKKKKLRELIGIEIDEISIVKSPANRKKFVLIKSLEGYERLIDVVSEFVSDDFDIEKGADFEEFLAAVETLKEYKDDLPGEVEDAMDKIVTFAVAGRGSEEPEEEKDDDGKLNKSDDGKDDDWPSIALPGNITFEAVPINSDDDLIEEDDLDFDDPLEKRLARIEKAIVKTSEPGDPWPSVYILKSKKPVQKVEKREPIDPNRRVRGKKKSIDGYDYFLMKQAASDEDVEDPYPSIPDFLFEK